MARIRSLKQEVYLDEELARCSIWSRWLFAGLWTICDREGRMEDRPARIKAQIYPYENVDVDALLGELDQAHFIIRYEVDGKNYLQVRSFRKHQRPHPRETESTIPTPPKSLETKEAVKRRGSAVKSREKQFKGEPFMGVNHGVWSMGCGVWKDGSERFADEPSSPTAPPPSSKNKNSKQAAKGPCFIEFPLNKRGEEYQVSESDVAEYAELFPAVDVRQELREMRAWLLANVTKRKTRRGTPAFITRWLANEQDRPRERAATPATEQRTEETFEQYKQRRAKELGQWDKL